MAGKIPQYFIDDLLDRVDIVDVINARVQLKKTGKNYSARCPFHDEKTPSFTVSPEKQFYHCFGCKASGNAIGFVIDFDRFSFPEAVEQLARDVGLDVPREETTRFEDLRTRQKKRLHETLGQADRFYRQQLRQHPSAATAVDYLKQRGLSGQIAATFGIGFAPPGWDNLLNEIGGSTDTNHLLAEAGLLIEKPEENKRYDRFRNRIMFPIRDTRGRTIAFGGRVLGDDKPKYLNSPETPVFHKGRELYGLYEATRSQHDLSNVVVVEGYMDVVALAQFDIRNAVATLGTAVTPAHLEKLFRYTPEVVFCFDGDVAGSQAAQRALENALPLMTDGRSARFLFLPQGEDPDSLVRQVGADAFKDQIRQAEPLSRFLFRLLSENIDTETPDGKARLAKLAAPYINSIPEGVFHELMISQLASLTGLEASKLEPLLSDGGRLVREPDPVALTPHAPAPEPEAQPPAPMPSADDYPESYQPTKRQQQASPTSAYSTGRMKWTPERTIIAILLNNPHLTPETGSLSELNHLNGPEIKLFKDLSELLRKQPDYTLNHILGYWRGVYGSDQGELLAEIAASDLLRPPGDTKRDDTTEFSDALALVKRKAQNSLPPTQQLRALLEQEHLQEADIKTIYKIWPSINPEDLDQATRNKLKQLIQGTAK